MTTRTLPLQSFSKYQNSRVIFVYVQWYTSWYTLRQRVLWYQLSEAASPNPSRRCKNLFLYNLYSSSRHNFQQRNPSTMVKTRQKSHLTSPLTMEPKRRRRALDQLNVGSKGLHDQYSFKEVLYRMLAELFLHGVEGFWFRILPVVDEDDDICSCLGVDWQHLCPVLHFLGLIGHDVTSVVKNCFILRDQWDELLQSIQKYVRCQITHCRTKKTGVRVSYFSIGEPIFRNPQEQERKGGTSVWLNTSSMVRKLKVDLGNAARKILQQQNYERIMNNTNNTTNTNPGGTNGTEDNG